MATYQLYRWNVNQHPATTRHPGYADVTLRGMGSEGFFHKRAVRYAEKVRVLLLPTDTADVKGCKAIVKRAIAQSSNIWRGRI